ncbi:MAG TPA: hypothetical protein VKT33_12135 [Candidatus Angelobacter sp.]|nr:hypothetical protein [Candidatus Angelobacter sp.]
MGSPGFYKITAFAFFIISGILFYAAFTRHAWFFWAMAVITLVNAIMTILKYQVALRQNNHG